MDACGKQDGPNIDSPRAPSMTETISEFHIHDDDVLVVYFKGRQTEPSDGWSLSHFDYPVEQ